VQRLVLSFVLLALIWAIGLTIFIARIPAAATDAEPVPKADGIVVFTGGGARLTAAMTVFSDGGGERLLISGVNPEISRARLAELWQGDPAQFDCCVDLGLEAQTTQGNAEELRDWAHNHRYDVIILITSDYHMPRALAAANSRLQGIAIIPFVVSSGYLDDRGRPVSRRAWRNLAGEYTKFLLARGKALFASIGA